MLNPNDTVLVSVVGTEGQSRATKKVAQRFNAAGVAVNEQGQPEYGVAPLDLAALQQGNAPAIPDFPYAEFQALQARGDKDGVSRLQLDYQRKLSTVQAAGGIGGGIAGLYAAMAKSVVRWLKDNHGFSDQEGDNRRFVLKAENIEITPTKINGATIYTLSGTAVFGA